jgi:hypothetical protein
MFRLLTAPPTVTQGKVFKEISVGNMHFIIYLIVFLVVISALCIAIELISKRRGDIFTPQTQNNNEHFNYFLLNDEDDKKELGIRDI